MHKRLPSKALRLAWIRRRARRIQRFFKTDLSTAVAAATQDWYRFNGLALRNETLRRYREMRA